MNFVFKKKYLLLFFKDFDRKTEQLDIEDPHSEKHTMDFLKVPSVLNLPKIPKLTYQSAKTSETLFGSLLMDPLDVYSIPDEILALESNGNGFEHFDQIMNTMRLNERSYFEAFTALIYMEEATESIRLQVLELKNAKFSLESQSEQIFGTPFNVSIIDRFYTKKYFN